MMHLLGKFQSGIQRRYPHYYPQAYKHSKEILSSLRNMSILDSCHILTFDLEIRLLLAGLIFIVAIRLASSYRDIVIMAGMLFNVAITLASIEIISS